MVNPLGFSCIKGCLLLSCISRILLHIRLKSRVLNLLSLRLRKGSCICPVYIPHIKPVRFKLRHLNLLLRFQMGFCISGILSLSDSSSTTSTFSHTFPNGLPAVAYLLYIPHIDAIRLKLRHLNLLSCVFPNGLPAVAYLVYPAFDAIRLKLCLLHLLSYVSEWAVRCYLSCISRILMSIRLKPHLLNLLSYVSEWTASDDNT